jgi:apolipoprotein N-acyltransferase
MRWRRPVAAVVSGLIMLVAFPPYGLWWAAPIGVAGLALTVHGRRLRGGFGLGTLAGFACFAPLLSWTNLHTGMVPWLLLSGLEAVYIGLLGAAAAAATPLVERWRWTLAPLTGLLWTAQEALRDRTPFGGFPWGRLAFSQGGSPLLRFAAVGGAPLVTFAVALAGGLLASLALAQLRGSGGKSCGFYRPFPGHFPEVAALVALVGVAFLVPLSAPVGKPVTVAIVQGSVPRLGLDFNAQRRAVLDNHVRATMQLAQKVGRHEIARPDLVIWPENSSDIDPTTNPDAAGLITAAAQAIGAPILVGAVLDGPGDGVQNTALVWQPAGDITGRYVKRHPVPFGEYIPLRSLARKISDKVDLVASDFTAGHSPGVLTVGPATIGDVICFEVAYDGLVRDTVTGGGQLVVVQTNNATFDRAEAGQQLAMVRLRAVEHGRDALMASTVGISGFVDASGGVHGATSFDAPAVVVRELHLTDRRTLAARLGSIPETVLVAVALAALLAAAVLRRRDKTKERP